MQQMKDNPTDEEQERKLGNILPQTEAPPTCNRSLCPHESLSGCLLGEVTSASSTQLQNAEVVDFLPDHSPKNDFRFSLRKMSSFY